MIEEERIMRHLDMLLSTSDPGDTLHNLHVLAAPPGAMGPLGMPDPKKVTAAVYAIDFAGPGEVEAFIAKVIATAGMEHAQKQMTPLWAGLSQETWAIEGDEPDELAKRLQREGKLHEHPSVQDRTVVYAACRDGRRWQGARWLTGPSAGQTQDVELLVGQPKRSEGYGYGPLLRRLVGLTV